MDDRRVIVDTDTASDDALALLLCALSERVRIDAVTTVAGNASLERVTENATYTLDVAGLDDVPVHEGAAEPLEKTAESAENVHGEGGLGDLYPETGRPPAGEGAVERLARADGISLLCLGPLTNVARALERDPDLAERLDEVVVMGGAYETTGNVTPAAEFNVWYDPDAAKRALRDLDATLVDWGVCVRDGLLGESTFDAAEDADTPYAEFFLAASAAARAHEVPKRGATVFADAVAATVLLAPDAAATRRAFVDVDAREGPTRGYTLVDTERDGQRTDVVTAVEGERYRAAVRGALEAGDPDPALAGEGTATLLDAARDARGASRAPYTGVRVGAALRTADGSVFTGCNAENANAKSTLHAEELALGAAVRAGHREFDRLVMSGGRPGTTPCGACRQVLAEYCEASLVVECDGGETSELGDLLP